MLIDIVSHDNFPLPHKMRQAMRCIWYGDWWIFRQATWWKPQFGTCVTFYDCYHYVLHLGWFCIGSSGF